MAHCCDLCHCFDFCMVGQKMSTKEDSSHYHHIFILMWWTLSKLQFYWNDIPDWSPNDWYFIQKWQKSDENVIEKFDLLAFEDFSITFPSHFHHNGTERSFDIWCGMYDTISLSWKCDGSVKSGKNIMLIWIPILQNILFCIYVNDLILRFKDFFWNFWITSKIYSFLKFNINI